MVLGTGMSPDSVYVFSVEAGLTADFYQFLSAAKRQVRSASRSSMICYVSRQMNPPGLRDDNLQ